MGKIYVIIVNYNGWKDTIECIDSVLKIKNIIEIIVVDNCSKNNSVEQIERWCKKKCVEYLIIKRESNQFSSIPHFANEKKIVLIENNKNQGFSAGNNIGIDFALLQKDGDYFWFLNNDTIVANNSLENMIKFMNSNDLDITSSVICYYNKKDIIQAIGTSIDKPYFHMPRLGDGIRLHDIKEIKTDKLYSFPGSSFLISKNGLKKINNKFDESYDFYYEEAELGSVFEKKKIKYRFCKDSIIWHKGGASFSNDYFGMYHMTRSQIIFVKRHFPNYLIFVISYSVARIIKAIFFFRVKKAKTIMQGIFDGLMV